MAFGSITKYHKEYKDLNMNIQESTQLSTQTNYAVQQAASDSIFNEAFGNSSTGSTGSSSTTTFKETSSYDTSAYEKAIDDAVSEANRAMALQIGLKAVDTVGQVALNMIENGEDLSLGGILKGVAGTLLNNVTGSNSTSNSASGLTSVLASLSNSTQATDINLTNDLDSALKAYSSRQSDSTLNTLRNEIAKANADIENINAKKATDSELLTTYNKQAADIDAEIEKLNADKIEQQKSVDTIKEGIIQAADAKIAELDADDKAQNEAITASQTKVSSAQTKLTSDLAAQDSIIASKTPDLQAVKTTTINVNGQTITQTVPDTAKRTAAQTAIDNANKEKERLQKEFDDLKAKEETDENSVQNTAKAKIEENAKARAEQEAIKANPQSDELTEARTKLQSTIDTLYEKQTASTDLKTKINELTVSIQGYNSNISSLNQKIKQAETLAAASNIN